MKAGERSPATAIGAAAPNQNSFKNGGRGMNKLLDFIRESKAELKKVSWPTRKQVGYSTLVVVMLTVIVGAYLGLVDVVLTAVFARILG